jgi:hypothetical protein
MTVTLLGRDGVAPGAPLRANALEVEAAAKAMPIRAAKAVADFMGFSMVTVVGGLGA